MDRNNNIKTLDSAVASHHVEQMQNSQQDQPNVVDKTAKGVNELIDKMKTDHAQQD